MPHTCSQADKVLAPWLLEEPMNSTRDRRSDGIWNSSMYLTFVRIYLWVGSGVGAGMWCTQDGSCLCFHEIKSFQRLQMDSPDDSLYFWACGELWNLRNNWTWENRDSEGWRQLVLSHPTIQWQKPDWTESLENNFTIHYMFCKYMGVLLSWRGHRAFESLPTSMVVGRFLSSVSVRSIWNQWL